MSSHYCLICLVPIYRVIPDFVHEYVCLNMECINFKASVCESDTIVNVAPQANAELDYPIGPLENGTPSSTANLVCVAQPFPQQATPQEPIALPQAAPAPGANRAQPLEAPPKRVSAKKRVPVLEKPMSELARGEGPDPLEEITEYAHRPVQRRLKEAEVAGRVKRPLNKFLLYRKAYNGTVKTTDMQLASLIIAESWAMEGAELRDYFTELAGTDTRLHKLAFPDYKYAPRFGPKNQEMEDLDCDE